MALLVFFPAATRARIIAADASEGETVGFEDVVDGDTRRRAKRDPSVSRDVCDREVAATNHVHSDDRTKGAVGRCWKFSHKGSRDSDLVRQVKIDEVRGLLLEPPPWLTLVVPTGVRPRDFTRS